MSLALQPSPDAADDYAVMHGELRVGRIYKRKMALRAEAQWLWALNGVPEGPDGYPITGLTATLEEARAALQERWEKWLEWTKLSEAGERPA
jgi:hypothetical protein